MKFHWSRALSALVLTTALGVSGNAFADSSAEDWKMTSSMPQSSYDSADKVVMNASRCMDMFDISTGEVSFLFTLDSTVELSADAEFSVKFAKGNESCKSESLEADSEEACESFVTRKSLTSATSPIETRLKVNDISSATSADGCEDMNESSYLYLIVSDSDALGDHQYTVKYIIDFRTTRPEAPTGITTEAGGGSIKVSWSEVAGAKSYNVYYGKEGASVSVGDKPEDLTSFKSASSQTTSTTLKNNISADSTYMITVTAVDANGNESLVGEVATAETIASKDFWQSYREENADVDGGFCFIATAAYGSTQEPHVQVLRQFRDQVLLQSEAGKKFVETYYRLSPPIAHYIGQHPTLRAATRVALWPLYGFAILRLYAPAALYMLLTMMAAAIGWGIYRHRRKKTQETQGSPNMTKIASILLAASALTASMLATPQDAYAESPVNMMFEFKAGLYSPDNLGDAWGSHFGDKSAYLVEAEYDYQLWRGVGSVAIGLHLGYGDVDGKSIEDSGDESVDTTELHWLPLRISAIYRFDYLWTRFHIPLTLYGKVGFDYSFWWVIDGSDSIAKSEDGSKGYGGVFGFHAIAGIAFVLDWLAPDMEKAIDVEWGINNSYIFAEYMYVRLDNFGAKKSFDLSDKAAFLFGLGLEF